MALQTHDKRPSQATVIFDMQPLKCGVEVQDETLAQFIKN
jgi:hypothetical protein